MDKEKHSGQKTESGTSGDAVKNSQEKDIDKSLIPEQQAASELTLLNSNKQEQKTGVETAAAVAENIKEEEVSSLTLDVNQHQNKHSSKKWEHYLFDFLMLFLAVTAGFFVDNKREYYIEHQRANQFSRQLLADLRLDSLLFENRNKDIQSMQQGHDSLLYLLTVKADVKDRQILETLLPLAFVFDMPVTTTTYNQMKASGSLRYIENMELTAHLQDYYDVLLPRSLSIAQTSLDYYTENINPYYLKHIRIQDYDPFNDTLLNKNPVIMERTKQTDQQLANIMGNYRALLKIQVISMNDPALRKIKETMKLLKSEYSLQ